MECGTGIDRETFANWQILSQHDANMSFNNGQHTVVDPQLLMPNLNGGFNGADSDSYDLTTTMWDPSMGNSFDTFGHVSSENTASGFGPVMDSEHHSNQSLFPSTNPIHSASTVGTSNGTASTTSIPSTRSQSKSSLSSPSTSLDATKISSKPSKPQKPKTRARRGKASNPKLSERRRSSQLSSLQSTQTQQDVDKDSISFIKSDQDDDIHLSSLKDKSHQIDNDDDDGEDDDDGHPGSKGQINKGFSSDGQSKQRNKFLERNRVAASKCRKKKRMWMNDLEETTEDLESKYSNLQREYTGLVNEVNVIKNHLMVHSSCNDKNIDKWLEHEAQKFVKKATGQLPQERRPSMLSTSSFRSRSNQGSISLSPTSTTGL